MVADLYLERDSFPNTINYNSFIRIDSLISAKIESVARILCFFCYFAATYRSRFERFFFFGKLDE